MKKTKEQQDMALEQEITHAAVEASPSEVETQLRNELNEERIKTEALSRRCIRLGDALDAAIRAEDDRIEQDMFDHINDNCYQREVITAHEERRRQYSTDKQYRRLERERKEAAAIKKALKKSALLLAFSFIGGFGSGVLGFAGYIHAYVAATMVAIALVAFGWAMNDCAYLLGRCK